MRAEGLDDPTLLLMIDPQTSGGLLLGVPSAHRAAFERECATRAVTATRIGEALEGHGVVMTA